MVRQLAAETHPGRSCEVTLDTSFERELGFDSLARVELMLRIGKALEAELSADALAQAETPRDVLRLLGQLQPQQVHASADLAARPGAAAPDRAQTLLDVLEWHATQQPERIHILLHDDRQGEQPLRYRELLQGARTVAGGLAARGLQPAQAVALMLPTGRDYLVSFFGILIAGGIPVPIYPPARMAQIEDHLKRHARILANAGAGFIITVEQAKPAALILQAAVPGLSAVLTPEELQSHRTVAPRLRLQAGDIAFLQYTSGSTGDPKGVVLTHANLLANIRALGQATRAGPGDVFVSWLPLYHDMGLIGAWFGSLYYGMPLVLMSPLAFLARPALWLQTITRHRGTISAAPNFAYELCVRHIADATLERLDLSSWRLALNGAEPVSPATIDAFARRFVRCGLRREAITPVYGLAECSVGLAFPPLGRGPRIDLIARAAFDRDGRAVSADDAPDVLAIPSCGRPLPGHEIRIVDDTGYELPERQVGRLEFRGPSATNGYFRNPAASAKLLRDGWRDSGDYAYLADGEVYIAGRVKDLIKRGGRSLYPYELEQAVGDLPGVRRGCVAAFASRDPAAGTERLVVMAETRVRGAAERTALQRKINQAAIETTGAPADVIALVPPHTVLKTSSGKIRRLASKEAYERGIAAQSAPGPRLQGLRFLANIFSARIKVGWRRAGALLFGLRAWAILILLAPCCGLPVALLQRPPCGRRIARTGARALFRLCGLAIEAHGLEQLPRGPHVLLANHASYLDAILLTALLPPDYTYAAKQELARRPLMRALLSGLGTLFIERFDITRSEEEVARMTAALKRGERLVVFPEGGFSRAAGLQAFHSGAFLAAAGAGVPMVAAGLRGTRAALRGGTWLPRNVPLALEIGEVFAPQGNGWAGAAAASAEARAAIARLSGEFAWQD